MKKYLFVTFGICSCLMACIKENVDEISIKSKDKMHINVYDTVLIGSYGSPQSLNLDVNEDNSPDFKFLSEIWGSPGVGQHPRSTLMCLNAKCMILGIIKTDTSFYHTSYSTRNISDSTFEIINSFYYSCYRMTEKDTIINIQPNQFKILPKKESENISKTDVFKSDTITLNDNSYSYSTIPMRQNDTIRYNTISAIYNCYLYPSDEFYYIGIKIKDSESEKIGWIKVKVSNNYKITIMESAIQK